MKQSSAGEDQVAVLAPRLRASLVAAYGPVIGIDAAGEALAWAYENPDRLKAIENLGGYLFRVGQTAARKLRRPAPVPDAPLPGAIPDVEPGLVDALNGLTEQQRICVVMVHALDYRQVEVAELMEISESSVRTHLRRGMTKLRTELKVQL